MARVQSLWYSIGSPSPLGDLAAGRLLHAHDLVAVEQTQRVEGGFDLIRGVSKGSSVNQVQSWGSAHLPHRIDRGLAQLMGEVVALDEADAVLALQIVN